MFGMLMVFAAAMSIAIGLLTWIKIDDWLDKKKRHLPSSLMRQMPFLLFFRYA